MRFVLPSLLATFVLASALPAQGQVPDATHQTYLREVQQAVERLVAGQTQGAETTLRNAIERLPDAPAAHCVQAELLELQGQPDNAITTYTRCATLARQASDAKWEASGLIGVMRNLLTLEGRIEDAREAAMAVMRFAEAHPTVVTPQLARERLQAIDLLIERDAAAASVRARREARARENAED